MFDILGFEYGRIPLGDQAAASFNRVHILDTIRPVGGFDTLAKLRWAGQIGPSIPVEQFKNTTINRWVPGRLTNRSHN